MKSASRWPAALLLAVSILTAVSFTSEESFAQSAALRSKAVDANGLVRAAEQGRLSVIVEFAMPVTAQRALELGADAAATSAVHGVQDRILADTFGTPDEARIRAGGPERHVQRMSISPMFAFRGSLADVEALALNPNVVRIHLNAEEQLHLAQSVPFIGMTQPIMTAALGTNRIVAVIDTGVMKTHSFIGAARVLSEACYSNQGSAGADSTCPGGSASPLRSIPA